MCCLWNGATVEWLIWLLCNLVVFFVSWLLNNKPTNMCESLVLGFIQDCGIHIFTGWSVQCTKNVLKRQKRDTVKSSVFSMDGDRSILYLHGNTVCCHLPVISCIILVRWLLCVMFVVWLNMSTSGHIVLLVFVLSCCMLIKGDDDKFCERLVTWIYCAGVFDVCWWRAFMFSCRGIVKFSPQED